MKNSKYLNSAILYSLLSIFFFITNQVIAQKNSTDSVQKNYPAAIQLSSFGKPKLTINNKEAYKLDKINSQNILVVFQNNIYAKDSQEFEKLKKELNLFVSKFILDRNSKSGIKLIQFYEIRSER